MQKVLISALLTMLALSLFGCRAAIEYAGLSGNARVSLSLSGLLPPVRTALTTAGGSRVVLPVTDSVKVVVYEGWQNSDVPGTTVYSGTFSVSSDSPSVSIEGLPDGESLHFEVTTLCGTAELSSGSASKVLSVGANEMALSLVPGASSSGTLSASYFTYSVVTPDPLSSNDFHIWDVVITDSEGTLADNSYQFLCNTSSTRCGWLGLYDANWKPVSAIYDAADEGWVLAKVSSGTYSSSDSTYTFHVVVANCVGTAAYPSTKSLGYAMELRPAIFVSPDGSGTGLEDGTGDGTPSAPYAIGVLQYAESHESYFLAQGDYAPSSGFGLSNLNLYGGFGSDFSSRTIAKGSQWTTRIAPASTSNTTFLEVTGVARLDGLDITAPNYAQSTSATSSAVSLAMTTADLCTVIQNCALHGQTMENSGAATVSSGLYLASSGTYNTVEVSDCYIEGSKLTGTPAYAVTTYGIDMEAGTLCVHDSDIGGGEVGSGTNANVSGGILSGVGQLLVSSCRIWGGYAASTTGVEVTSTVTSTSFVVNSMVSGGYASGASSASYGVYSSSTAFSLAGDCIDSGQSGGDCLCVDYEGSGTMLLMSSVLSSPTSVLSAAMTGGDGTISAVSMAYLSPALSATPSGSFTAYASVPASTTASGAWFSTWLASNDWKLKEIIPLSTSEMTAASIGAGSLSATWPAVLVDRAGMTRSTYSAWAIGMYSLY